MTDPNSSAVNIFNSLATGREADKRKALEVLDDRTRPINHDCLRGLLLKALSGQFKRERGVQELDAEIARARPWLLSALGRLSVDDQRATKLVKESLDPDQEPDKYARYWVFEGLIASGASNLKELALDIVKREEEPLVRMLAVAWLASQGNEERTQEIRKGLEASDLELQWAALWALYSMPIEAAVPSLCRIVRNADREDNRHLTVYRAIWALGSLPSTFRAQTREEAASTLANFIRKQRVWPAWDESRTKALTALGKLGDESIAPTLVEELTDDNPAIAREASLALEKVMGVQTATARVVEAACKLGQNHVRALANALRWMNYTSVVEELEAAMVTGSPGQREAARDLLSDLGGAAAFQKLHARRAAMENYTSVMKEAEEKIQNLFDTSIEQARTGFKVTVGMDVVVFSLGALLLSVSAVLALLNDGGSLSNWAGVSLTGGVGVLGVLYGTLIAKPRQQVQQAVNHLMHLKVVFLAYLRQLHQADQAYTRHLMEDETCMAPEDVNKFRSMVEKIMKNAVQELSSTTSTGPQHHGK